MLKFNKKYKETELYKKVLNIVDNIEVKTINNILDDFIEEFDQFN